MKKDSIHDNNARGDEDGLTVRQIALYLLKETNERGNMLMVILLSVYLFFGELRSSSVIEIVKPMYTDRVNNCLRQLFGGEQSYMSERMIVGLILLSLGILSIILAATLRYRKNNYAMLPGMLGAVVVVIGMVIATATLFY